MDDIPESVIRDRPVPHLAKLISVQQFSFGQSTPKYLIRDANNKHYVLRRKPSANSKFVLRLAHAIEREFYVLNAVAHCNADVPPERQVPVPELYLLCEDEIML